MEAQPCPELNSDFAVTFGPLADNYYDKHAFEDLSLRLPDWSETV